MFILRIMIFVSLTLFSSLLAFSQEIARNNEVKVIDEPFVITNPSVSVVLDHPYFQNGLLDIPIVDTPDQAGLFQDGLFQYDAQIDAWRLLKFNTHPVRQGLIQNVEIIITDTFPVQVFLKVSSPDIACNTPGRISKRFYDYQISPPLRYQVLTSLSILFPLRQMQSVLQ
jgi:hypothetical protein